MASCNTHVVASQIYVIVIHSIIKDCNDHIPPCDILSPHFVNMHCPDFGSIILILK